MDSLLPLIWQQFGSPWLLLAVGAGWLLHATGAVGHLIGARSDAAAQLADQRQHFTDIAIAELSEIRRRHALDVADLERRIKEAHQRSDEERINAKRWRHLLGTFGTAMTQRARLLDQHAIPYLRIDYTDFIADGGDADEFEGFI